MQTVGWWGREKQRRISEVIHPQSLTWQIQGETQNCRPSGEGAGGPGELLTQQRPAPTLRVNWTDAARPGRRASLSTPSDDPRAQCAWGRDPRPHLPQPPRPCSTLQECEAGGGCRQPPRQAMAHPARPHARPAEPWVRYILNGNTRPFFSRSRMVSSPHRLVSSMKGGEQILSSGDRGEPVSALLPASHPWPLPGTDPPPWGPPQSPLLS